MLQENVILILKIFTAVFFSLIIGIFSQEDTILKGKIFKNIDNTIETTSICE